MAWAIAGATLITAGIAANSASKSRKAASKAAGNELAFAQEQYADWLDAFGDIQTNLSEYYENLTPDFIETQALQAFEQEKEFAFKQLEEDLAQRGIDTSGLAKELETDLAVESAAERARIRAEAPLKAAQVKQEFLQVGLGQNPASNVQGALANRTAQLSADARLANENASRAVGAAVDTTFNQLAKLLETPTPSADTVGAPVGNPNNSPSANIA